MTEGQAVCHGLAARLHLYTLIQIEQAIGLQELACPLLNDLFNGAGRNRLRNDHGDVAAHCREFGDALVMMRKGCLLQHQLEIDACNVCPVTDAIGLGNRGMNLSEVSDRRLDRCSLRSAVRIHENNAGLASRMQEGLSGLRIADHLLLYADALQEVLCNAL